MSNTITVRLPQDLADWLRSVARRRGVSQSQVVKDQLEKARGSQPERSFMRVAGAIRDLRSDLSQRKGYSRSPHARKRRIFSSPSR